MVKIAEQPKQATPKRYTYVGEDGQPTAYEPKPWHSPKQIEALLAIKEYNARRLDDEPLEGLFRQLIEDVSPGVYDWGFSNHIMANIAIYTLAAIAEDPALKKKYPGFMHDELPGALHAMYDFFSRLSLCTITEAQVVLYHTEEFQLTDKECDELIAEYKDKTISCKRGTTAVVRKQVA